MKSTAVAPWRARLQIALWRHGSAGTALLVAMLLVTGLLTWTLQQMDVALTQTRQALEQEHVGAPAARTPAPANDEAARVAVLQALLATSPAPDEVVRGIAAQSNAVGITWTQGDYRQQWHPATQTTQWQVTQPALATYPQLRQLIDAVLRAHPNVSLDQVTVQRDDTAQAQVQVRLRWSIWTLGAAARGIPFPVPGN